MKLHKLFEEILRENNNLIQTKVNQFVYHKSAPINREKISKEGLIPMRGEQWLSNTPINGKAIFATNSNNPKEWFDSSYDDDVYKINTTKISNKWFIDPNFINDEEWVEYQGKRFKLPKNNKEYKHVFTFDKIPIEAIELIYKGSGNDLLEEGLKSKSAKGNRYFKMLETGMFQHYDMPKGELSPIGDDEDRKRLVSKLSQEDKKKYREWLKTPEGKKSLENFKTINENFDFKSVGLIKTQDYLILIDLSSQNIVGVVAYDKVDNNLFHVPAIASERGYGYLLYNIVMSLVSPNYIITDRDSSTNEKATSVLRKMLNDSNIEHIILDKTDKNYVNFNQDSPEEQQIKNTKFKIKNKINLNNLLVNGNKLKNVDLDDLNEKAFHFFSKKLNY